MLPALEVLGCGTPETLLDQSSHTRQVLIRIAEELLRVYRGSLSRHDCPVTVQDFLKVTGERRKDNGGAKLLETRHHVVKHLGHFRLASLRKESVHTGQDRRPLENETLADRLRR
jgi:hypothetical protein